uniref:Uncharacterized protein n=1 Tax=Faecalibaculum rodentium TaxID=1702221 RepID=A0A140DXQ7_9FIRM|nr:hypothetical protein AALO17_23000 [Faecalibaculum rodentium]
MNHSIHLLKEVQNEILAATEIAVSITVIKVSGYQAFHFMIRSCYKKSKSWKLLDLLLANDQ